MKSNRVVLTSSLFALLVIVIHPTQAMLYPEDSLVNEKDHRCQYLLMDVYKMLYCDRKRCPKWKCQDDSAVIHGYCCGCPSTLIDHAPVHCVDDLRCPLKMKDLCEHYQFMTTCCC